MTPTDDKCLVAGRVVRLDSRLHRLASVERHIPISGVIPVDGIRVLVVDDEHKDNDLLYVAQLARYGIHDVHFARDGVEALRRVCELRPHLVAVDTNMPNMMGPDVCKALRIDVGYKGIVVGVSGVSTNERLWQNVGADGYAHKFLYTIGSHGGTDLGMHLQEVWRAVQRRVT